MSGLPPSIWTWAWPRSGPSVLTQAALPLTVNCVRSTIVATAEPAAQRTVPPYAPVTVVSVVQLPFQAAAAKPFSSAGCRGNAGPVGPGPHAVASHERTRNWYAVPVTEPIFRATVVLVAPSGSCVPTGGAPKAPRVAGVLPVAIWSSERVPVAVHFRPTWIVLAGLLVALVICWPAARLWIGAVAFPPAAGGVLPTSLTVWSVVLAASSANDTLACRVPAACGAKATLTFTLAPGATVAPSAVLAVTLK